MTRASASFLIAIFFAVGVAGQTTSFPYQGSLNTGGTPANGGHDFEFALIAALKKLVCAGNQSADICRQ
jgi:hypothetical protein